MSFSSLLSQIKHKTPPPESNKTQSPNRSTKRSASTISDDNNERPVVRKIDPAVQRLKELRRHEKAEKEVALAAAKAKNIKPSKPRPPSQKVKPSASSSTTSRSRHGSNTSFESRTRSASPPKRLTFAELMKQGKEKSKHIEETVKDPSPKPTEQKFVSKTKPLSSSTTLNKVTKPLHSSPNFKKTSIPRNSAVKRPEVRPVSAPKPLAQPSAALKAKLDARKKRKQLSSVRKPYAADRYGNDDEDEEDDFIVHDVEEEVQEEEGYDRDEIWKMFNRGKGRSEYSDYDDDLSDMEAAGVDILEEEEEAERKARLEEKREMERERKRIEEKKKRLLRK